MVFMYNVNIEIPTGCLFITLEAGKSFFAYELNNFCFLSVGKHL